MNENTVCATSPSIASVMRSVSCSPRFFRSSYISRSEPRLKYILSKEHARFFCGGSICDRLTSPEARITIACPGSSSLICSASRSKAVCSTGRSLANTRTSSSSYQNAGRIPHGSRIENISPLPVIPQITKPPSHSGADVLKTLRISMFSSMNRVMSFPCKSFSNAILKRRSLSRSRR